MALQQGYVLNNRYRIVSLMSEGVLGAVYRGWDLTLSKSCILKENTETTPTAQSQFMSEGFSLVNLRNPNLQSVTDYFTLPGQGQYLVLDYLDGQDLFALLGNQRKPMAEEQAVPWICQVCDALTYLHLQNPPRLHLDVKPSNIKITSRGNAVLMDLSLGKAYDRSTSARLGLKPISPGYSPQEQYGSGVVDPRTDIYALGATLYHILTGQAPIESVQRFLGSELPSPASLNPNLSPAVEQAILTAMALFPAQRYQNANDFKLALLPGSRSGSTLAGPAIALGAAGLAGQPAGLSGTPASLSGQPGSLPGMPGSLAGGKGAGLSGTQAGGTPASLGQAAGTPGVQAGAGAPGSAGAGAPGGAGVGAPSGAGAGAPGSAGVGAPGGAGAGAPGSAGVGAPGGAGAGAPGGGGFGAPGGAGAPGPYPGAGSYTPTLPTPPGGGPPIPPTQVLPPGGLPPTPPPPLPVSVPPPKPVPGIWIGLIGGLVVIGIAIFIGATLLISQIPNTSSTQTAESIAILQTTVAAMMVEPATISDTPVSSSSLFPSSTGTISPVPASDTPTPTPTATSTNTETPSITPSPTLDRVAPPPPDGVAGKLNICKCREPTYVKFSWNPVMDPAGISVYKWVLERSPRGQDTFQRRKFGETAQTNVEITVECGYDYRVAVQAVDRLGNTGEYSRYASIKHQKTSPCDPTPTPRKKKTPHSTEAVTTVGVCKECTRIP